MGNLKEIMVINNWENMLNWNQGVLNKGDLLEFAWNNNIRVSPSISLEETFRDVEIIVTDLMYKNYYGEYKQ